MFEAIRRAHRVGMLRKYEARIAIIILGTLTIAALNALEPLVMKYVFDGLTRDGEVQRLIVAVAALALLGIVREFLAATTNYRTWQTRLALHQELLDITVGRLHRLSLSFHRGQGVGAIMTRLDRGIQGAIESASQLAFNVIPAVLFLLITTVVMFRLEWRLAVLILVLAPLPPLIAVFVAPRQTARERELLDRWSRIYSRFNEVLSGIMTVKSFTREHEEKRRFITQVAEANQTVIGGVAFDATVGATQNLIVLLARVAALLAGGILALRGEISVGTLVAFLGYVGSIFAPVQGLSGVYRTMQTGRVAVENIEQILDVDDTPRDAADATALPVVRGEVRFEELDFAYAERPVLRDVSLAVTPGETIALVGPSGHGKSTLMALLQRFYDPQRGRILIDGIDIRTVTQESLRRQIGMVPQDAVLFDDSVANNIAYGRPEASRDAIVAAAKAAHAHEFIMEMAGDYEATVGEKGARLSGGERQRIAIARAILKDPPILILDEATSALDAETEALVQEAVENLVRGRTTFIIAHRLATVVGADRVCVLQHGVVTECGSHAELMRRGGYYASLVRRQTRGLLPEGQPEA